LASNGTVNRLAATSSVIVGVEVGVEVGTIEGIAIFVVAVVLLGDAEGIIVGMDD